MRKVSEIAAQYFTGEREVKRRYTAAHIISSNTSVVNEGTRRALVLHNSEIMFWSELTHNITVTLAGWDTNTTRARLNDVLHYLYIRKYLPTELSIGRDKGKTWVFQMGFKLFAFDPNCDTFYIKNVLFDSDPATRAQVGATAMLRYASTSLNVNHRLSSLPHLYEPVKPVSYVPENKEKYVAPKILIEGVL